MPKRRFNTSLTVLGGTNKLFGTPRFVTVLRKTLYQSQSILFIFYLIQQKHFSVLPSLYFLYSLYFFLLGTFFFSLLAFLMILNQTPHLVIWIPKSGVDSTCTLLRITPPKKGPPSSMVLTLSPAMPLNRCDCLPRYSQVLSLLSLCWIDNDVVKRCGLECSAWGTPIVILFEKVVILIFILFIKGPMIS